LKSAVGGGRSDGLAGRERLDLLGNQLDIVTGERGLQTGCQRVASGRTATSRDVEARSTALGLIGFA
jgi:hypothetical protein